MDTGSEPAPVETSTGAATSPAAPAMRATNSEDGGSQTTAVVSVPSEVLDACWPDTMDEEVRGKHGEEVVVLPNGTEARLLTDTLCLEMLFLGRPKGMPLPLPQAHLQAEHLRCLLRLSRVRSEREGGRERMNFWLLFRKSRNVALSPFLFRFSNILLLRSGMSLVSTVLL